MPREGRDQAQRRRTANGISKRWKIARLNRRPRGLVNTQNSCYRHGALQPLLHLPRFVNWIKNHNLMGHWPCHANDPNRQLPTGDPLTLEVLEGKIEETKAKNKDQQNKNQDQAYRGCVPCLLKKFMTAYWDNTLIGNAPSLTPQPLPHQHPAILPLHQLIERWFCVTPPSLVLPPDSTQEAEDQAVRAARKRHMTAQQDAEELTGRIFEGIQSSYNLLTPHGASRGAEFDSLFAIRKRETHTCDHCDNVTVDKIEDEPFNMRVFPRDDTDQDTVEDAIARSLENSRSGSCDICKAEDTTFTIRNTIVAAPEYLRIYLMPYKATPNYVAGKDGEMISAPILTKNRRHITIPDTLDLTQHMEYIANIQNPYPVRYKLVSATYHEGAELNSGHYTAAVTGPALPGRRTRPQFLCNDTHITDLPLTTAHTNSITENPIQGSFDAITLYYERIAPTGGTSGPANRLSRADQLVIEEGNAREKVQGERKCKRKALNSPSSQHGAKKRSKVSKKC